MIRKKTKTNPFIEAHRPKHGPIESPVVFKETKSLPPKPKTLFDMYLGNNPRLLQQDVARRPDHYTDRQKAVVAHLSTGARIHPPVKDQEKNELVITYSRSTEADKKLRDQVTRLTTEEPTILTDGTTLEQHEATKRVFGQSDPGDIIII